MSRNYAYLKVIETEIFELKAQGTSNREIRERFGLNEKQLENLITRHNKAEKMNEAGVLPRRRGRPSKNHTHIVGVNDNEIKRLRMENQLLRDFLRAVGRM